MKPSAPTTEPASELVRALEIIRDGRCACGGRFKWTGNQMRCEQCDRHEGWGIAEHYRKMARAVLARAEAGT